MSVMSTSPEIAEIATALSEAQGEIASAKRDSENPHFRSAYASLAAVVDAVRGPMAKHGLSIVQFPKLSAVGEDGKGWMLDLETRLMHKSGQWLSETTSVPLSRVDAQGVGSAITYARRYALMAVLGVAPADDDDGNAAVGTDTSASYQRPSKAPKTITDGQRKRLFAIANQHGWSQDALEQHLQGMEIFNTSLITRDQYDDVIASIEAGPVAEEPAL